MLLLLPAGSGTTTPTTSPQALRIARLNQAIPIADADGNPSAQFQRQWQNAMNQIVGSLNQIIAAQAATAAATAAAAVATAAAATANSAATNVTAGTNLANSYVTGATITATDAGTNATLSISAHTRVYGDGSSVAVSAGSITGLPYSTLEYVYYDDAARVGGAVTYLATTSSATAAQAGIRHTVGSATTPAALGAPISGKFVRPPGVGAIQ
jgi:hypothetical protein